jgi:hypothetical protein
MRQRCKAYPAILEIRDSRFEIRHRRAQPFIGSSRYWRGRIIELLRHATGHSLPLSQLVHLLGSGMSLALLRLLVLSLVRDHLVVVKHARVFLPE